MDSKYLSSCSNVDCQIRFRTLLSFSTRIHSPLHARQPVTRHSKSLHSFHFLPLLPPPLSCHDRISSSHYTYPSSDDITQSIERYYVAVHLMNCIASPQLSSYALRCSRRRGPVTSWIRSGILYFPSSKSAEICAENFILEELHSSGKWLMK